MDKQLIKVKYFNNKKRFNRNAFFATGRLHCVESRMTNLFTAIEGAALSFPELDYAPLVSMLNREKAKQRTAYRQHQSRSARVKVNKSTSLKITTEVTAS